MFTDLTMSQPSGHVPPAAPKPHVRRKEVSTCVMVHITTCVIKESDYMIVFNHKNIFYVACIFKMYGR